MNFKNVFASFVRRAAQTTGRSKRSRRRRLPVSLEALEVRLLLSVTAVGDNFNVAEDSEATFLDVMANDVIVISPGQNPDNPFDVNDDGDVTDLDALLIRDRLRTAGPGPAPSESYYDVNGDFDVTSADRVAVDKFLKGKILSPHGKVQSATQGSHGVVKVVDGNVTYRPDQNYFGTDTFTYEITGGFAATVTVTVTPVNDAPANSFPKGKPSTPEDTAITFSTANGKAFSVSDVDAGSGNVEVAFTAVGGTVELASGEGVTVAGSGTSHVTMVGALANINAALSAGLTFTPDANFSGEASILMTTSDLGNTGTALAGQPNPLTDVDTIRLNVRAVNDAPVNTLPASLQTDQDVPLVINSLALADLDAGSSLVHTTISVTPKTGVLELLSTADVTVNNNNRASSLRITGTVAAINAALAQGVRFTLAAGFFGSTTFTMVTNDRGNTGTGGARQDTDSVTVQVRATARPLASNDKFSVTEDSLANIFNVLANDFAHPGAALVLESFTQPLGGVVSRQGNSLVFAPAADFNGLTSFTYTINDSLAGLPGGGIDSTATVNVTVTEVNDAPTVVAGDAWHVGNNVSTQFSSLQLLFDDQIGPANEAGQTLRITSVSTTSALGGTVSFDATTGFVTYTPPPAAAAGLVDSITYVISDDGTTAGAADPKTATGVVNVILQDFRANNDVAETDEGSPGITIDVLQNDVVPAGSVPLLLAFTQADNGTVTRNDNGTASTADDTLDYVPIGNFYGHDSFTYTMSDGFVDPDTGIPRAPTTATVIVTVHGVNDPPVNTLPIVLLATSNADLVLSQANGNALQIADIDVFFGGGSLSAEVALSVEHGTLSVGTSGVAVLGNNSANVVITGQLAAINAALAAGVTYRSNADFAGQETLTMVTSDLGNTGAGGAQIDTDSVPFEVAGIPPSVIGGVVYIDANGNGIYDLGELGIARVEIGLDGTDSLNRPVNLSTFTDSTGRYSFSDIRPGSYFLHEVQPIGIVDGDEAFDIGLVASGNDGATVQIDALGNVISTGNLFGELGVETPFIRAASVLVPSPTNPNSGIGLLVGTDGVSPWSVSRGAPWSGYNNARVTIEAIFTVGNVKHAIVTLIVSDATGNDRTVTLDSSTNARVVFTELDGTHVIGFKGTPDELFALVAAG